MKNYFLFFLLLLVCLSANAQNEPPPDTVLLADRTKKLYILPLFSYSPETSFRFGAIGIYLFRPQEARTGTLLSSIKMPITYTLNNQPKVRISYDIFLNGNEHILEGFAQWQYFPLFFYGIGSKTTQEDEEIFTSRTFGAEFSYLNKVAGRLFLGGRLVWIDSKTVEREAEGLLSQEGLIPGNDGGVSTGIGLVARLDSRDNNFNATKGIYLQSSITTFQRSFGGDFKFTKFNLDFRKFFYLFQKHVLAFQLFSEYNWGQPPFELLALLGSDELMRGHYEGRFRDKMYWASQVEYRLPINRREWLGENQELNFWQRWGLAAFAGLGTVAPNLNDLTESGIKYSLGFGIRYLILPKERVNIRIDFGFGTQQPGFYMNVREAF